MKLGVLTAAETQAHKKVAPHKSERMDKRLNGFTCWLPIHSTLLGTHLSFLYLPRQSTEVCVSWVLQAGSGVFHRQVSRERACMVSDNQTGEVQNRTGRSIRSKWTALDSKPQLGDVTSYFLRPVDLQARARASE